ncbi:hypothetical protein SHLI107390_01810 [Shewanella livingstonensis]
MLAPEFILILWGGLIGCGLGACFALTLTVTLNHLSSPKLAGALTAFVQGVGFIVTAVIPYYYRGTSRMERQFLHVLVDGVSYPCGYAFSDNKIFACQISKGNEYH